ncbi:ankyrin [Nemania sp. NC0429]|nr:ankyrin [Nemania sp. NC0429]
MDRSVFAPVVANILTIANEITGSLRGKVKSYFDLAQYERLFAELSHVRSVLQFLEATALSGADGVKSAPLPGPRQQDILLKLMEMHTHLSLLASRISQKAPNWAISAADYAPRDNRLSPAEIVSAVCGLETYLSKLRNSIAQSVSLTSESTPGPIADPTEGLWKDCADYEEAHDFAYETRLHDTGRWFLETPEFHNWRTADHVFGIFSCSGPPGSGKTILMSLVIDEIQNIRLSYTHPAVGLAYFYFSYKSPTPIRNVALALLEQLYHQSLSPDEEVKKLEVLAAHGEHIPLSDIVSVLIHVSVKFRRSYIIIDAIDECAAEHQKDLSFLLREIRCSSARCLVSSRQHYTFDLFGHSSTVDVIPSAQDIKRYAGSRLIGLPAQLNDLRDSIVSHLLKLREQHHSFLPIVLQLNAIRDQTTTEGVGRCLGQVSQILHSVYQGLLERVEAQEPHMVEMAKRTLTWLYYSQRPLTKAEIIEIHRHATGNVEADASLIVRSCMGFVHAKPQITFIHSSVREFLEGVFICGEEEVASHSLSYLSSLRLDQVASQEAVDSLKQSHPLLDYAANYWGHHLHNIAQDSGFELSPLKESCLKLLQDQPKVTVLCHILFIPVSRHGNEVIGHGLVKSSWLHLTVFFGLDWVIDCMSDSLDSATECDEWGRTPLHIAAENGFDRCVRVLLTHLSPNQQDVDGRTAWHYSVISGNPKVINHLLDWSSNTRLPGQLMDATGLGADKIGKGKSPLDYAAANGDVEMFGRLLSLYTDTIDDKPKVKSFIDGAMLSAIEFAVNTSNVKGLRILLRIKAEPDGPIVRNGKPMLYDVLQGMTEIIEMFLSEGAQPTEAVSAAAEAEQTSILRLLESGKRMDMQVYQRDPRNEAHRSRDTFNVINMRRTTIRVDD